MKKINHIILAGLAMAMFLPFGSGAQGVHIGTGASFIMTGPANLVISDGGLINDGTFSAGTNTGSNLSFMGTCSTALSNIGGANPVALQSLTLEKNANDIQLNRDITVAGFVNMGGGNLQLNRHTMDLGATGNVNDESDQSHIAGIAGGRVLAKTTATANTFFSPGTLALAIRSDKAGIYQIVRQNSVESLPTGGKSIQLNYSISGPAGANVSYTIKYFESELNGNNEQNLVYYVTDRAGNPLTAIGRSSIDTLQDFLSRSDTALFGHITFGAGVVTKVASTGKGASVNTASMKVDATAPVNMRVYPNPAHDRVTIDLVSATEGDHMISLYDQAGHMLQQKRIPVVTGRNTIVWDLGRFMPGIYYLRMDGPGGKSVAVFKK